VIGRLKLPTQIYIPSPSRGGRAFAPTEKRIHPPSAKGGGYVKPGGGLWTSTFETHGEQGWFNWCSSEQPNWLHRFGYLLEPVECRVFEIATKKDHDKFHDRYARPLPSPDFEREWKMPMGRDGLGILSCVIDWEAVLADADAVRLVNPWEMRWGGEEGGRWAHTITFYGWDCESTWWSRWLFDGKAKRISLPDVICPECHGTGWEKKPDYSAYTPGGEHLDQLSEIFERAVECPACGGSGRRPDD